MDDFSIELVSGQERIAEQAKALIDAVYAERFGICLELPEYLLVARDAERMLGTFGITTNAYGHGLRLPRLYSFDRTILPFPDEEGLSVEFGRWISSSRLVSASLMHYAASYSIRLGKEYAWCEQTHAVHRASRMLGVQFRFVSQTVCTSLVEQPYAPYYRDHQPSLYLCKLAQVQAATASYLRSRGLCPS